MDVRRVLALRWGARRWLAVTGVRVRARAKGSHVDIEIAPTARLSSRVRFIIEAGTRSRVEIGPGCHIERDVTFRLLGGALKMGPGCSVRSGTVVHLGGDLELVGDNMISYYNVIHCAERIRLDRWAYTSEFVTLVDSTHFHDGEHEFSYENQKSAPIEIGRGVWLANKSSVLLGVTIGDEAVVAAHAVVHRDVPPKAIVGGIPAQVIRQR